MANNYFEIIAAIWDLYFRKRISMSEREAMLSIYRAQEFNLYK